MKISVLRRFISYFLILVGVFFGQSASATNNQGTLTESEQIKNYRDAYIFAYPLVLMDTTKNVLTNVVTPEEYRAPINQFAHLSRFPDAEMKEVIRPNVDTLYSSAWLDLKEEPIVLSVFENQDRYYLLPLLDAWTNVFKSIGTRTTGKLAKNFVLIGPNWHKDVPGDLIKIKAPTNIVWIIGRTQTNGADDYSTVHKIQQGYQLTPLSDWGKPYPAPKMIPVNTSVNMKTPPMVQVLKMDPVTFFTRFAELLKDNPPSEADGPMRATLKAIDIVPGQSFDAEKLTEKQKQQMKIAVDSAKNMIMRLTSRANNRNGWHISHDHMGNYGTDYLKRAYVAMFGLGANLPEDAVYPMSKVDAEGVAYHGNNHYILHFNKAEFPPVKGFWSLTLYQPDGFFYPNSVKRYAISSHDQFKYNEDGSLDIYIQHEPPVQGQESNWLPAPDDHFNLLMRLYWPDESVLNDSWVPPAIRKK